MNRWQQAGEKTDIQKFSQTPGGQAYNLYYGAGYGIALSDQTIGDASFVRLKNVSLSYHFPANWNKCLGIQEGEIYFHGQNLLTITKYVGLDPETIGVQGGVLPPLRVLSFGIHFTL
jgi:hypothetical protein